MKAQRPSAKVGLVFLGWIFAFAMALLAVDLRQRATQGPDAQASAGMYAAGDMMLGVAVFGALALGPIALGLYWLRPVEKFWSALTRGALLFALTGLLALAAGAWVENSTGGWILLLSTARIGLMPLSALALLTCALFAPRTRHCWLLFAAAATDGAIFMGIVLVKFVLPGLSGA